MDNYFSLSEIFNSFHCMKINAHDTVCQNRKKTSHNSNPKQVQHPEQKETSGLCTGRTDEMYMSFLILTFHLQKKTSRNLALKPLFNEYFITHMGHDDVSGRVTDSYNTSKRVCKWTKRTSIFQTSAFRIHTLPSSIMGKI